MENKIADTLLEHTLSVTITETKKFLFKQKKIDHVFALKPPTLGIMLEIGKCIQGIDVEDINGDASSADITEWIHKVLFKSGDSIIKVLNIILNNGKPNKKTYSLIRDNVTPKELQDIFSLYLSGIDVKSFISSIVLIKSANIIKTSPTIQGS